MIRLRRLSGTEVVINALLIESVEAAPDTAVSLVTGNRFLVQDSVEEVVSKVVEFQRRIHAQRRVVNPIEGLARR